MSTRMRSKFEQDVAKQLRNKRVDFEYEKWYLDYEQATHGDSFVCNTCGSKAISRQRWYLPDFVLKDTGLIIEAKGRFTAADRKKMKAVKDNHPDEDIRILFQRNNKIHKNSEKRYTDWCDDNGFPCAVGTIPDDWLPK